MWAESGRVLAFVLVSEPYHETGDVLGVFSTLEGAKAGLVGSTWTESGTGDGWIGYAGQQKLWDYRITMHEIDPATEPPAAPAVAIEVTCGRS